MNIKLSLLALLAGFSVSSSYAVDATSTTTTTTTKDNEILSWLIVVNKNEINAAKETLKKATNHEVKEFAKLMIKDHTKNLKETQHYNKKFVKTADVKATQKQGEEEAKQLSTLSGKDYDKAYINDMVTDHEGALKMIDSFGKIENAKVSHHIEATRKHVEHHLTEAKELQKKLES